MPAVPAGIEHSTLRWHSKCSMPVLLFRHFLSTGVSWNWTFNFGMTGQWFYLCATPVVQAKEYFLDIFLSDGASCDSLNWTLDFAMTWQVFYPCGTAVVHDKEYFLDIFSLPVLAATARIDHSTLGWHGKCSTLVLPLLSKIKNILDVLSLGVKIVTAWIEHLTLGWYGKCSTHVLLLLFKLKNTF